MSGILKITIIQNAAIHITLFMHDIMGGSPDDIGEVRSHLYIRRGNRRLSLAALAGRPAAWRGFVLPLVADARSVFQSLEYQ